MSVLVLGAGMVSGPVFEFLHDQSISFSVVSVVERELEAVKGRYPDVACLCMDVLDAQLPTLISQHQLVINLLPHWLMIPIARICIDQRRHMLSASYVTPELVHLHERAMDADVLLFFECGLDPGLDHMLSMKVIDSVTARGCEITSFTSWCGGIPAPEYSNTPLQYKFSWNPKAALSAADASYIHDGQVVKVPGSQMFDTVFTVPAVRTLPDVMFEGRANRCYPHHLKAYGLEKLNSVFRGTLRYKGSSESMKALVQAGLLSKDFLPLLKTDAPPISWRNLLSYLVTGSVGADDLEEKLLAKLDNSTDKVETLKGLGLLSDKNVENKETPFDTLAAHLQDILSYGPEEKDMIVMLVEIQCQSLEQRRKETHSVELVVYGDPAGHSAMAKTVGYTVGIVAKMILKGEVKKRGLVLPTTADIYEPVLSAMKDKGVAAHFATHVN